MTVLPPRAAQPALAFLPQARLRATPPALAAWSCCRRGCGDRAGGFACRQASEPGVPAGFPVDVLELEPSPISGFMLGALRGGPPEALAWPVVAAPARGAAPDGDAREPFGFLRLKRGGAAVNLHLLPFNYPVLFRRGPPLGARSRARPRPLAPGRAARGRL